MKKARKTEKNELRPECKRSGFTGPLVRGKYAKRLRESSNIVVLKPEQKSLRFSQTKNPLTVRFCHL